MRRIFIECTRTHQSDLHTGIQRVVRNYCYYLQSFAAKPKSDLAVYPVVLSDGHFEYISFLHKHAYQDDTFFNKNYCDGIGAIEQQGRVFFSDSDILLLVDAAWYTDGISDALSVVAQQGTSLIFVWHDLLPIQLADYFPSHTVKCFSDYLSRAVPIASAFLAVSHTVQMQLENYVSHHFPEYFSKLEFGFNYSGSNIIMSVDRFDEVLGNSDIRCELFPIFNNMPVFIQVGTIEPRKNHLFVLQSFELLWQQGYQGTLCFIGAVGWKMDKFLVDLASHDEFGKKLFWFSDLTDKELVYAYQHASVLIYSSQMEGFGLPIVEALQYGMPVFASDIDIHHEVGGDLVSYFSLYDHDDLCSMVRSFEPSLSAKGLKWLTWDESSKNLLDKILLFSN